jgi:TRAP-type C4-dicarboxylate transport system substrate-binding protein
MAALAFTASPLAKHVLELPVSFHGACLLMATRAFDPLPVAHQQVVRNAAAKFAARMYDVAKTQDELLMKQLFRRQGVEPTPPAQALRSEFLAAARTARETLDPKLVPPDALRAAMEALADFRAYERH